MEDAQHKVTKEWINSNRTDKGAFTRKQILALGIKWPPTAGWIDAISGELISCDQARAFEMGKGEYAEFKPIKYKKILSSLEKLTPSQLNSIKQKIDQILRK